MALTKLDSKQVAFQQSGTGAVDRTVHGKFAEWVSINDFGAVSGVNSTVAIAAAFASGATHITAAPGTYLVTDEFTIPAGVTFDARGAKFVQTVAAKNIFKFNSSHGAKLLNVVLEGYVTNTGPAFELANGVYAFGSDRIEIRGCTIHGFEYNGIFLRNCNDYVVDGNLLHSNRYINSTSADILAYSTALSRGGLITGNRCHSNNSQGIYIGAGGFDADCTIKGNRCITLDSSFAEVATPNVKRRHGIQIGYGGTSHRRHIVVGNVIKVTSSTGIYYQGHYDTSSGSILIAYNYIKDTGIDTVQAPLSSGITLACQGEGDVVVGNVIEGTFVGGVIGTSAGISLQPNTGGIAVSTNRHTLIQGNTVTNLAGSGIQAINEAVNVTISDNRITGAGVASIFVSIQPIGGSPHSCRIINNSIRHSVDTTAAIHLAATAGSGSIEVRGNEIVGPNNTTNNVNNSGVFIANSATAGNQITVEGNFIRNFRAGVATGFYLASALPDVVVKNNRFVDLHTGIAAGGTGGRLVGTGNEYKNCTANTGGGPLAGVSNAWEGSTVNGSFQTYLAAAPTTGVWSVGDRVQRNPPAVGQPKAWSCTVAGVPGTWVSEGNL